MHVRLDGPERVLEPELRGLCGDVCGDTKSQEQKPRRPDRERRIRPGSLLE